MIGLKSRENRSDPDEDLQDGGHVEWEEHRRMMELFTSGKPANTASCAATTSPSTTDNALLLIKRYSHFCCTDVKRAKLLILSVGPMEVDEKV